MDFQKLMKSHQNALSAKLDLIRAALKHSGQKGFSAENAVASLLRDILPERIGISEGIVISSEGYVSPQVDLILYDQISAPIFFKTSSTKAIPIEYVYGLVEVKMDVDSQRILKATSDFHEIRSQPKHFTRDRGSEWVYRYAGQTFTSPPISAFLVCFQTSSIESCWSTFENSVKESSNPQAYLDSIFFNSTNNGCPQLFTRSSIKYGFGDLIEPPTFLSRTEKDPLLAFLSQLWILSIQWRMLETPEMYRYVRRYHFEPVHCPFPGAQKSR